MPYKDLLEDYSLYQKYKATIPARADSLQDVSVNMICPNCNSHQTFVMVNEFWDTLGTMNSPLAGQILILVYDCAHCKNFRRTFFVKISEDREWAMKVGQYPAWEVKIDPETDRFLGEYSELYKRGMICEFQGYGIGAYGYYRRIVEGIIDKLLDEIPALMNGDELSKYKEALIKTKGEKIAKDKIKVVKDLLPPILRPNGMNPLDILHTSFSIGLHLASEEECLESAHELRNILLFLIKQVLSSTSSAKEFTESMKKQLEKRSK
jgi:hypothetical protein